VKYYYNLKLLFSDVVNDRNNNISIEYMDKKYTYQHLDHKSDLYAIYLIQEDVKQGDVIAIVSTKSFEDYSMMIACLKIGAIYVNLDKDNPSKRTENIINICKPKIVFSLIELEDVFNICMRVCIKYKLYDNICYYNAENINLDLNIDGDTIAYIMFTSGSTGIPKGVAITHQNVIHFIDWIKNRYDIQVNDKFTNISPMYFDNSVFDFYGSLFNGATLVPIKKHLLTKPIDLVEYIDKLKCTIWFSVPSMLIYLTTMRVLNRSNLCNIRTFTFGGEGYPKLELKKLYYLYSSRANFINVYGPTECTCICSSYTITKNDFEKYDELAPIGVINQNISYEILDNDSKVSCFGELCLLGPNVGVGYYNDEEKTNNSFLLYSNREHYNKSMYKTGDLVEEKNKLLYFRGRIDNQIKHMGYRIELEEIECAIDSLQEVSQNAVLYKRVNSGYGKIIAYISLNNKIEEKSIIKKLKEILPSYMIPSQIKILKEMPKNQNNKIDRHSLIEK
jgi:D-alanine--poly(phosphoribitol) ligase subunit 1